LTPPAAEIASDAAWAQVFDERFERRQRFPLTGLPSRLRLSPDGRRAAATVFTSGHSYNERGFATTTTIFDLESGTIAVTNLEQFTVSRGGAVFKREDFNFWGVTFMPDGDTFYATLSSGGRNYLVRGSVDAKTATVIHEGWSARRCRRTAHASRSRNGSAAPAAGGS
jgi:hypothetical protein